MLVSDAQSWLDSGEMIYSGEGGKTTADAAALLDVHNERKAEIDARQVSDFLTVPRETAWLARFSLTTAVQEELRSLHEEGARLSLEQPDHKVEVRGRQCPFVP